MPLFGQAPAPVVYDLSAIEGTMPLAPHGPPTIFMKETVSNTSNDIPFKIGATPIRWDFGGGNNLTGTMTITLPAKSPLITPPDPASWTASALWGTVVPPNTLNVGLSVQLTWTHPPVKDDAGKVIATAYYNARAMIGQDLEHFRCLSTGTSGDRSLIDVSSNSPVVITASATCAITELHSGAGIGGLFPNTLVGIASSIIDASYTPTKGTAVYGTLSAPFYFRYARALWVALDLRFDESQFVGLPKTPPKDSP
ncbi:MAG: hypothetical protein NTY38_01960 [Acidobacteria bacterium]|nr:hypothetical protein [Acidobacteriota bacterium]